MFGVTTSPLTGENVYLADKTASGSMGFPHNESLEGDLQVPAV
jgi:hypothetical protein